jgi:hypothetical protein
VEVWRDAKLEYSVEPRKTDFSVDARESATVCESAELRKQQRRRESLGASAVTRKVDRRVNPGRRLEDWLREEVRLAGRLPDSDPSE